MFQKSPCFLTLKWLSVFLVVFAISCRTNTKDKNELRQAPSTETSFTLKNIRSSNTLKVGVTADFMPFSYKTDSSNAHQGIDIVMAQDFAESLGVRVLFVETSWSNLMQDLKQGKFDIGMSGITIIPARKREAFFSVPVYASGKVAITRDENVGLYTSIDKINRKEVRVIFNPGGTNEAFARANFPNAKLILNENNISIFQKLVDRQADVMVTDAIETMIQERIHPELEAVNPLEPFNSFNFGYLIPKDSLFKVVVDEWLLERKKDSVVIKLLQQEIQKLN